MSDKPMIYQIRLKGHLSDQWEDWFEDVTIQLEENGETVLTCRISDQAALHGVIRKIRDLGISLIAVNRVDPDDPHPDA